MNNMPVHNNLKQLSVKYYYKLFLLVPPSNITFLIFMNGHLLITFITKALVLSDSPVLQLTLLLHNILLTYEQ